MTNAVRTTATQRVPTDSMRKTALVAGVFYLLTFLSSIPAVFLLGPVLDNPDYIVSAGADTRVTLGAFLDLVNAVACIGTAVALFPVVRRRHEGVALGFVTARVMEAAIIAIGVLLALDGVAYLVYSFAHVVAPGFAAQLVPWIQLPALIGEGALCLWLLVVGVNVERWQGRARAALQLRPAHLETRA